MISIFGFTVVLYFINILSGSRNYSLDIKGHQGKLNLLFRCALKFLCEKCQNSVHFDHLVIGKAGWLIVNVVGGGLSN